MALPTFKLIEPTKEQLKQKQKWEDEINSVLNNVEDLYKQFNKDLSCKNTDELSYKLYVYKKNNLNLFHKILHQYFYDLLENDNKEPEYKNMGKIEINEPEVNTVKDNSTEITEITENVIQQFPLSPNKKGCWNMLQGYIYEKPEKPEFDMYSVEKLVNNDTFLKFALHTIENEKGYEEALKTIYNKYIKDDKILLKQLSIYESYYTIINENINQEYVTSIENVLQNYELALTEIEKMKNHIYTELTKLIDINIEFVEVSLTNFDDTVKSELYDLFKNKSILELVTAFEKSGISYNEIITSLDDYNSNVKKEIVSSLESLFNISNRTVEFLLMVMSNLEITNFLYIDDETSITVTYFTVVVIIFKKYFNFAL